MAFGQGTSESLVTGFENGFKTLPSPVNGDLLPISNLQITPSRNSFTSDAIDGVQQPNEVIYGKGSGQVSFDIVTNDSAALPALKAVFGTPRTHSGSGTSINVLEYGFSTMLPMFAEDRHTDVNVFRLIQGMLLGKMSMSCAAEGLSKLSLSGVFAKYATAASTGVTGTVTDRTTKNAFSYLLGRVKQGGTTRAYIKEVDISIDRKAALDFAIDQTSEAAVAFYEKPLVSGKISAFLQDTVLLALGDAGTQTSLELWIPGANGVAVLAELPTIKIKPGSITTNGTGLNMVTFDFDAYGKSGTSTIPGRSWSTYLGTGLVLSTLTLTVNPDASGVQTFTFTSSEVDPDTTAAKINATATGFTASVDRAAGDTGGVLRLESATKGSTSSINVTGGTANTTLKFPTGAITGRDNESVWISAYSSVAA